MSRYALIVAAAVMISAVLAGCDGGDEEQSVPTANPSDFQAAVDHPFFPLASLGTKVFEGEERDPETGEVIETLLESRVLPETDVVAGVEVTVVEDKEYEDGELVEATLDYFAQHSDGTVYYFGEQVDEYEGGEVVGHMGQWLAGEGDNEPGVFMPAELALNQTFQQEKAPGVAEDTSKVVALDTSVSTPAGSFSGCMKTEDVNPLDNTTEHKYYCPDVGLVREEFPEGHLDLISYE